MLRERILTLLRDTPPGLPTATLLERLDLENPQGGTDAVVEALLLLSPEVSASADGWRLAKRDRAGQIIDCIDVYSAETGRRIFRAASALERMPLYERPTVEELQKAMEQSSGRYELLPNEMIRRNR